MRFTFAYSAYLPFWQEDNCLSRTFFPLCHSQVDIRWACFQPTSRQGKWVNRLQTARAFSQDKLSRLSGCANKILVSVIARNATHHLLRVTDGISFDRI